MCLPHDNFFDKIFGILLIFASFLMTYCNIYSSHILFFYFFLIQISVCIYLLLVPLFSLCFFDNKFNQYSQWNCIHSFLYTTKKIYKKKNYDKTPLLSAKLEPFIMLIASSLLIYQK